MGWFGPCRDECGCDKTRDDFTGSSLDSGKWNEWDSSGACAHDGTFRIQSDRLNLYGDSSGDGLTINTVAKTDMQTSAAPSAQRVEAIIKRSYTGHTYRIMANWVKVDGGDYGNNDRYIYAEFVDSTGDDVTLTIGLGSCMTSTQEYGSETRELSLTSGQEMVLCLYVRDTGVASDGTTLDDVISATLSARTADDSWGSGSGVQEMAVSTTDYAALNDNDAGNARAGIGGKLTGSNYTTIDSDWFVEEFTFEIGNIDTGENKNACGACYGTLNLCGPCDEGKNVDTLKLVIPSGSPAYAGTHILTFGGNYGGFGGAGELGSVCCYYKYEEESCATSIFGCDPRPLSGLGVCVTLYQKTGTTQLWLTVRVWFLQQIIPNQFSWYHCGNSSPQYSVDENTGLTWSERVDCVEIFGGSGVSVPCAPGDDGSYGYSFFLGRPCTDCEGPATVTAI